jgi:hypothetical protein
MVGWRRRFSIPSPLGSRRTNYAILTVRWGTWTTEEE